MTLAALAMLGWPDEWLDGEQARQLQRWLVDETPLALDGSGPAFAMPHVPPDNLQPVCRPPEHLLFFLATDDDVAAFCIVLLGTLSITVRVQLEGRAQPRRGWRLPPKQPPLEITWDELLLEAAEAYIAAHDAEPPDA